MKILVIVPLFAACFFSAQKLPLTPIPELKIDSIKINFKLENLKKLDTTNNNLSKYKMLVKKPENPEIYLSLNNLPKVNNVDILNNLKSDKAIAKENLPKLDLINGKKK